MSNPAINAALLAAAAQKQAAQDALLNQLTSAKAFTPSAAIVLKTDGKDQDGALKELVGHAVVRPIGAGRFYLDRERKAERARQQGHAVLLILAAMLSILASVLALTLLR